MLVSEYFPAWYLGRNPGHNVIAATYAQELADDFGRKVRNQIAEPSFRRIFPGIALKGDSQSSKRFHVTSDNDAATEPSGAYFATGIGGPLTGRGGNLILLDDLTKNREEAESEAIRQRNKDWYTSTAYTRLMRGGRIVLVMCMTGDTPVLMADGTEIALRDIKVGDMVASYSDGRLRSAEVLNWANQGSDIIVAITTSSGTTVRANERHPFLVARDGGTEWVKVKDLRIGDRVLRATGASGAASPARSKAARYPRSAKGTARVITKKCSGQAVTGRRQTTRSPDEQYASDAATESTWKNTRQCSPSRAVCAPSASNLPARTFAHIGGASCASITTTRRGKSGGCSATTATSPSVMPRPSKSCSARLDTYEIIHDEIVSIRPEGREEVFDIQVSSAENFIANGLVSHNTRWHDDDVAGWLLREHAHENWVVLNLPAIAEADDAIGRHPGEALWPDAFPLEALAKIKESIGSRDWSALYQQRPTPAEGGIFKAEWFKRYEKPREEYSQVVQSWDTAFKPNQINDPSACTTWGVRQDGFDLLHVLARRMEYPDLKSLTIRHAADWGATAILIEDKASGQSLIQDLRRETQLPVVPISISARSGDKTTRASAVSAMVEAGKVSLPRHAPWLTDYEVELTTFPNATHDDMTDSTTQFLNWIRTRGLGDRPLIRRL